MQNEPETTEIISVPHLETASGAVLCDDADVGWIDAGSDEPVEVVVRHLPHQMKLLLDGTCQLHVLLLQHLDSHQGALV